MTQLVPRRLEELAAARAIPLDELLARAKATEADTEQEWWEGQPKPDQPPRVVPISDYQKRLLRSLPAAIADAELPEQPRQLSDDEKNHFVQLFHEIKLAKTALETAEKAFKQTFANALDVEAQQTVDAELGYDANGHVLREGEIVPPGYEQKVTRELRGGKAASLSLADLKALEDSGEIDHRTFLALTTSVPATRRPDEAKIMDRVANNPDLLTALASVANLTPVTASIYVRKNV